MAKKNFEITPRDPLLMELATERLNHINSAVDATMRAANVILAAEEAAALAATVPAPGYSAVAQTIEQPVPQYPIQTFEGNPNATAAR